jgi:glycosyltransferase involved in cell wall biosynthesis
VTTTRVAHIIHDLRPGGTERRLLAVLRGLERERFEPILVCIDGLGPLIEDVQELGLKPFVLGRVHRFDPTGIHRLVKLLRSEKVEIVHGWLSLGNAFGRIAGTLARVPVRIAAEGAAVTTASRSRARRDRVIDRLLDPATTAYVANSETVAVCLRAKGLSSEKIVVIPNGVAIPEPLSDARRVRLRSSLGASPDMAVVGMVGRLDPDFKDHHTFLTAVASLLQDGRLVRGVVIGDGPARGTLERFAEALGIEGDVVFTGYRPDAVDLLQALDVAVYLTYSEGFSNVVLESMAAGVPLMATDIPSNREAVSHGLDGLLVQIRNPQATCVALRRLLDDQAFARRLGEAGRRRVSEHYSLQAQAQATMQLYERMLEMRR